MINEEYISFYTAMLLKEKGFNEKCQKVYSNDGTVMWAQNFMEGESFVDNDDIESIAKYNGWIPYIQGGYAYLCPTQSVVMKWLREVHKIDIDITSRWNLTPEYHICEYRYRLHYSNAPSHDINQKFNTYEEACEASIKYCLENLI